MRGWGIFHGNQFVFFYIISYIITGYKAKTTSALQLTKHMINFLWSVVLPMLVDIQSLSKPLISVNMSNQGAERSEH